MTGQPVLLPGTNRTSSFLCVANEGARATLNSTSHGTGTIISDFERSGVSGPDPRRPQHAAVHVRHGERLGACPISTTAASTRGSAILVGNDIVRPVARMRPIAGLN